MLNVDGEAAVSVHVYSPAMDDADDASADLDVTVAASTAVSLPAVA